jgi:AraC-like DNA-binding protein
MITSMADHDFAWWGREHTRLDELHHLCRHRILRTTRIPDHALPCTEIGLVAKGEVSLRFPDGGILTAVGGQAVVIAPGVRTRSADGPLRGLVYWIGIAPDPTVRVHPGRALDGDEAAAVAAALALRHGGAVPMAAVVPRAQALAEAIAGGTDGIVRRGLGLLLIAAVRDACVQGADSAAAARTVVAPALELIRSAPGGDLLPDDLARRCGVGRTRFNEQFLIATGFPPRDYITRCKLDAACALMAAGTPVAVAAKRVGFSSGQYLATAFRRVFATTPSAWLAARRTTGEGGA